MLADVSNVSPSSEQRDTDMNRLGNGWDQGGFPLQRFSDQTAFADDSRFFSHLISTSALHDIRFVEVIPPTGMSHSCCLKIQIKKMNKRRTERRIRPSELSQSQWLCHYLAVAPFLFSWHPNLLSCMRLGRGVFFGYCRSRLFINLGFASASCHHVLLILCCRSGCFSSSGWVCGFPLQRISSVTLSQKA